MAEVAAGYDATWHTDGHILYLQLEQNELDMSILSIILDWNAMLVQPPFRLRWK